MVWCHIPVILGGSLSSRAIPSTELVPALYRETVSGKKEEEKEKEREEEEKEEEEEEEGKEKKVKERTAHLNCFGFIDCCPKFV